MRKLASTTAFLLVVSALGYSAESPAPGNAAAKPPAAKPAVSAPAKAAAATPAKAPVGTPAKAGRTPAAAAAPEPSVPEAPVPAGLAKQIVDLTGSRTKIVWERGSRDHYGVLMCFDTAEGKERVVVPGGPKCKDPKLTPDATRILFTSDKQDSYIVNWDGSGLKQLFKGRYHYIMGVALDPATRVEWVYVGDNQSTEAQAEITAKGIQASDDSGLALYRHRLDDLTVKELVWDKVPFNRRLTIAADGSCAYGEFPWPNCGVAVLPNVSWKMLGQGCNGALAPDGSGRFFHLIGDHRNLKLYNTDGSAMGANVLVNGMPGNEKDPKRAVWRPRWSNNVHFFTIQSADLGPDADIALGQFDEKFTKVQSWVRIADTPDYDADAVAWIEPASELGKTITDHLDVPALKALVARLDKDTDLRPLATELAAMAKNTDDAARAEDARRVFTHARRWVTAEAARVRPLEAEQPLKAWQAYKALAAKYKGTGWGGAAEERLRDPGLAKEVKALGALDELLRLEKELRPASGKDGAANASDKMWLFKNKSVVTDMVELAREMKRAYPNTMAWTKAQELLDKYGIELEKKKGTP